MIYNKYEKAKTKKINFTILLSANMCLNILKKKSIVSDGGLGGGGVLHDYCHLNLKVFIYV